MTNERLCIFLVFSNLIYRINNVLNCILVEMALLLERKPGAENSGHTKFFRPIGGKPP